MFKKVLTLKTCYFVAVMMLGVSFVITGCGRAPEPQTIEHLDLAAESAIIKRVSDGKVVYAKDPDKRFPPASTTKVLTAIVALENMSLTDTIEVSRNAAGTTPTVVHLEAGKSYRLADLLAAILIRSGNDAAVAIAEGVAGSEEEFAEMMNEKARQIGMTCSNFERASGLPAGRPDRQYTTSRDLAKLMLYAKRYDIVLQLLSRPEAHIRSTDGNRIRIRTNNRTLVWDDDAPWGKTGYTREARRTFVGVEPSLEPRFVFALLRSNDLWEDIRTLNRSGRDLFDMLDIGGGSENEK